MIIEKSSQISCFLNKETWFYAYYLYNNLVDAKTAILLQSVLNGLFLYTQIVWVSKKYSNCKTVIMFS